jgi:two-component system chemotaxis response regulator CheY
MPAKRVLSLGQCGADHWSLERLFERHFDATVVGVDTLDDALTELGKGGVDLVLVNRMLDRGGSGLDCIAELKRDPELRTVPVMLVSNLRDPQRQAVELGALPGFGKAALDDPQTLARLRGVLGD